MTETRLPSISDFADAEHCVLEDVTMEHPALPDELADGRSESREMLDRTEIRDRMRGRRTVVRIYSNGWIQVKSERRGRKVFDHRIDLQYLDPVPEITAHYPWRLLKASGILAGVSLLFGLPAWFGWLSRFTIPAAALSVSATIIALLWTVYLSHEKIHFQTLHGRANAIRFGAGLGTIRRFHKLLPKIVGAIADAAESVQDETVVYLRSEMREHYRLRNDGVLSDTECAASTGRILGEFDGPL